MNRMSPLIVRRPRSAAYAAAAAPAFAAIAVEAAPALSEDVRLFATNFLGGLAFFGTYLA
ncbi:MAG TPA: hypothetical protein VEZ20_10130 [Allosphingosinicella sp.]|jgi:hypothetical protein|nr:hypothetical protein [Allosphingosinicella sp.]